MGKVQRIAVGRKPGERKLELPDEIQVSLTELGNTVKEGLFAFASGVGLEVFRTLLAEDVTVAAGPKGRHDRERGLSCVLQRGQPLCAGKVTTP
jgi:hypothetical protein